jgi:DNA-binding CsgD family transcriptional regulator
MSRPSAPLALSDEARRELEEVAGSQGSPIQEIRRARALLLAADGLSNVAIADRCGFTPRTIASLRARFGLRGVAAVRWDRRGRVPPVEIPGELIEVMPDGALTINGRPARAVGLYVTSAQRAVATTTPSASTTTKAVVSQSDWASHRHFLSFLKTLDREVHRTHDIVLLLDRWPGHADHHDVDRWLSHPRRSRFHLHYLRPSAWQRVAAHQLRPLTRRSGDDGRNRPALARL